MFVYLDGNAWESNSSLFVEAELEKRIRALPVCVFTPSEVQGPRRAHAHTTSVGSERRFTLGRSCRHCHYPFEGACSRCAALAGGTNELCDWLTEQPTIAGGCSWSAEWHSKGARDGDSSSIPRNGIWQHLESHGASGGRAASRGRN